MEGSKNGMVIKNGMVRIGDRLGQIGLPAHDVARTSKSKLGQKYEKKIFGPILGMFVRPEPAQDRKSVV